MEPSLASQVYFSGEPPRPWMKMITPVVLPSLGWISIGSCLAGKPPACLGDPDGECFSPTPAAAVE